MNTFWCSIYGLKSISLEEEIALPLYVKQTRENKMKIVDMIGWTQRSLNLTELRIKQAPELDSKEHSELIQEIYDTVKKMKTLGEQLVEIGYV